MNDLELECPFDENVSFSDQQQECGEDCLFDDLVWPDFDDLDIPEKKKKNKAIDYNALYGMLRLKFYLASLF